MKKHYLLQLLKIAIPIMLSQLISQVQMLTDRAFLGHANDLYMSALGNAGNPMWTTMATCFSIVTGSSIIISQTVGAGDKKETVKYSASLLKWMNVWPVILFIFWITCGRYVFMMMGVSKNVLPMCMEYMTYYSPVFLVAGLEAATMVIMQTSNYTFPLVIFGAVRSALNVFLDWVMIFGRFGFPAMGIKGAAIATAISEYMGVLVCLVIFVKSKHIFTRPDFKSFIKASPRPFLKTIKLGINTALEDFLWNGGNLILVMILNSINEKAAGIYSMIFGIELLVVVFIGAFGNATMTMTGEATGARDIVKYKTVPIIAYKLSVFVSVIMLIICLAAPKALVSVFTRDKEVIAASGLYLILMCVNLFSKSGNVVIGNTIRGHGDTRWMLFTQVFGTIGITCFALFFVKVMGLGIAGVIMAVIVDEFLRVIINFLRLRYIMRRF